MKFNEMQYERPSVDEVVKQIAANTEKLKNAKTYAEAKEVFLAEDKFVTHVETLGTLASIRHDIDTRDAFYKQENEFWLSVSPELEEYKQAFNDALLDSAFRKEFEKDFGSILFINGEMERKAFSPLNIEDMKKENQLAQD